MSPLKAGPKFGSQEAPPAAPEVDSTRATASGVEAAGVFAAAAPEPAEPAVPATHFLVSRWKKGDSRPHFDEFDVPIEPGATVLDALLEIRRRRDPSLVVRHSCLHASCGVCGIRVNGRETLACDRKVADLPAGRPVRVEPLANQRPIADLATDMVDFYARFEAAGLPAVRAAELGPGAAPPENVKAFRRFENCIECGLCLSACPVSRADRSYIGPAALAAAARVAAEPRGLDLGPVLALASEPDSVWRCRDALECTAVCPAGVDPAMALFELRRSLAAAGLRRFLRRG